MKLDAVHKALAVMVLALIVAGAFLGKSWLAEHDAAMGLKSTMESQKAVIDSAAEREKERDAQLAVTLADFAKQKAAVVTASQAAIALPKELNQVLPQPITINVPPAQPGQPAPAAQVDIPPDDLKPLNDMVIDCQACKAQVQSDTAKIADQGQQIGALEKERDAAVKAAKGGGFWHRVKKDAEYLAIGAAIGFAVAKR